MPDCVNHQTLENNFLGIITHCDGLMRSNIVSQSDHTIYFLVHIHRNTSFHYKNARCVQKYRFRLKNGIVKISNQVAT